MATAHDLNSQGQRLPHSIAEGELCHILQIYLLELSGSLLLLLGLALLTLGLGITLRSPDLLLLERVEEGGNWDILAEGRPACGNYAPRPRGQKRAGGCHGGRRRRDGDARHSNVFCPRAFRAHGTMWRRPRRGLGAVGGGSFGESAWGGGTVDIKSAPCPSIKAPLFSPPGNQLN